jgi:hypothetical protein
MAKLYLNIPDEQYNELTKAAIQLYGYKRGNKKKAIDRCLKVGIADMQKEIEENKKASN